MPADGPGLGRFCISAYPQQVLAEMAEVLMPLPLDF